MPDVLGELVEDKYRNWSWKTRDGRVVPISEMPDTHLRNVALFLMGMGYIKSDSLDDRTKVAWLVILKVEWQRRMAKRDTNISKADSWSQKLQQICEADNA